MLWKDKVFVPKNIISLSSPGNDIKARSDLYGLSVKQLKDRLRAKRVPLLKIVACVEKREMVELLADHEGSSIGNQALARYALRASLADARRNTITEDELTSFVFNVRLRADGRLRERIHLCAWNQRQPVVTEARFGTDRKLTFTFPPNFNPFGDHFDDGFGMLLTWRLVDGGSCLQLEFNGSDGPQEYISRHPKNWGWLLMSGGTCWTSWPMPKCGEDPEIEDAAVARVLNEYNVYDH